MLDRGMWSEGAAEMVGMLTKLTVEEQACWDEPAEDHTQHKIVLQFAEGTILHPRKEYLQVDEMQADCQSNARYSTEEYETGSFR